MLLRVLYAHALGAAPGLALGRFAPLGRCWATRASGWPGRSCPSVASSRTATPPTGGSTEYIEVERGVGRLLDYGVIGPRLQLLYGWAARELHQPDLLDLISSGCPVYVLPLPERWVWRPVRLSIAARVLRRVTPPR